MEVGQSQQVIIVFKIIPKEEKTITHERRIFNTFNWTTHYPQQDKKKIKNTIEERDYMDGAIIYIKFSGDYDKFDEWKEKTKAIAIQKGIFKYVTK